MLRIEKISKEISVCSECKKDNLQKTYKIEREHFCVICATRKVFHKKTGLLMELVRGYNENVDYEHYLKVVENILKYGGKSTRSRVIRAAKATLPSFIFRKMYEGKYVILTPVGKHYVVCEGEAHRTVKDYIVDNNRPFESICDHVQKAINHGLPFKDVAEFIWKIRGKHDYITAMMYADYVTVTWPHGQKELRLQAN